MKVASCCLSKKPGEQTSQVQGRKRMPTVFQEKYLKLPGPLRLKAKDLNTVAHREINTSFCWTSLVAQIVKHLPTMQETWVQSLCWEDLLEKKWQLTWIFLPGKSHVRRNLIGYSPWGHKESDTTEWLHFHFFCSGQWANSVPTGVGCSGSHLSSNCWGRNLITPADCDSETHWVLENENVGALLLFISFLKTEVEEV